MKKENIHILKQLKRGMLIALVLAVVGEIVFFPSLANFYGCVMAVLSFGIFTYFLNELTKIQTTKLQAYSCEYKSNLKKKLPRVSEIESVYNQFWFYRRRLLAEH